MVFEQSEQDFYKGKNSQGYSSFLDGKIREDLERVKKIWLYKGLRHFWASVFVVSIRRPLLVVAPSLEAKTREMETRKTKLQKKHVLG